MTLNLNKVGRLVCKIVGGKYKGHVVSVSDSHGGVDITSDKDDPDPMIKEFIKLQCKNYALGGNLIINQ